jgi:hypothetical protein
MQVVVMRIATSLPKNSQILIKRGRVVQALYQGGASFTFANKMGVVLTCCGMINAVVLKLLQNG